MTQNRAPKTPRKSSKKEVKSGEISKPSEKMRTKPEIELTEEMMDLAVKMARDGCSRKTIADALGMSERTLYNKLNDFADFAARIKKAEAQTNHMVCEGYMQLIEQAKNDLKDKNFIACRKAYMDLSKLYEGYMDRHDLVKKQQVTFQEQQNLEDTMSEEELEQELERLKSHG